jgi:PEP-CTERM motif
MKTRKASFLLALATLVCSAAQSNAGILTFTSQAAYNAAIAARAPLITRQDSYDAIANGPVGAVSSYVTSGSGLTATYSIASALQLAVSNATTPTPSLGINDGFDPNLTEDLTITIGPNGRGMALQVISNATIGGVNGDFLVNANGSDGMGPTNIELAATGVTPTPLPLSYTSYFFGFVADTPLDSLTNVVVSTTSALNGYRVDNVSFAAVPEPSSLALLGMASLIGLARRRQSRTK